MDRYPRFLLSANAYFKAKALFTGAKTWVCGGAVYSIMLFNRVICSLTVMAPVRQKCFSCMKRNPQNYLGQKMRQLYLE
jgi:hypothetical protein